MGLITPVRAQIPAVDPARSSAAGDQRTDQRQSLGNMALAGETTLPDAPQPVPAKPMAIDPEFLTARNTPDASAAATAEAARAAYIHASIAAGISPLPLPGV